MGRIRKKLNSESGLSILLAMFFLALCIMVSALVVTASLGSARAVDKGKDVQQAYLTTCSVAEMMTNTVKNYGSGTRPYFTKLLEDALGLALEGNFPSAGKDYTVKFDDVPQMDPVTMTLKVKCSDLNVYEGGSSIVFYVQADFELNKGRIDEIGYRMTMPWVEIEKTVTEKRDGTTTVSYRPGKPILMKGGAVE